MSLTLDHILTEAHKKEASDIHLIVGRPPMFRIHGTLHEMEKAKELDEEEMEKLAFTTTSEEQKEKFLKEKELDCAYSVKGLARFRVNLHFERSHVGLVARIIPEKVPTMEEVDMPDIAFDLAELHQGLVLVTGPTGSGKSTTLAALIEHMNNTRSAHIVTMEDPIEFMFESKKCIIRQRQLDEDMRTFAAALKHVLRQDPDIVLVGEMRDLETIGTALTLAETGHLVLATLHTSSAAETIDRVIDVFPPHQQTQIRIQLAMSLESVISQRLLPKKGGGRLAAREILINNPAVANLIREGKSSQIRTVIQTSAEEGMISMDQTLKILVKEGKIERDIAKGYMHNPESLT